MANVGPPSPTPGKRDPRTLGNDDVASPTGTPKTTSEAITGAGAAAAEKQAAFGEISDALLGALGELQERHQQVSSEFNEEGFQKFREASRGNWLVQFHRAMDPKHDRNLKAQFDSLMTRQLVSLSSQMANVAASFRLSNPVLNEAMSRAMKRSQDQIDQTHKIATSEANANLAMEALIRSGNAPTDPIGRQKLLSTFQSSFMRMKSADDLLGEQLRRENLIGTQFVTEDDVERWGSDMAVIVRNRLEEQKIERKDRISRGSKSDANFKNPMNLMSNYMRFVGFEEDMLRLPMPGVPQMATDEESLRSDIIRQETKLELTQGIGETAKLLALDRFAKWVEHNVGLAFVPTAIERLGIVQPLEDLNSFIDANGPLTPDLYKEIRDQSRTDAIEAMERNVEAQLEMRFQMQDEANNP